MNGNKTLEAKVKKDFKLYEKIEALSLIIKN